MSKAEPLLILVKGDPLSRAVEKDAKQARFDGKILKLSFAEASQQGTPLPVLFEKDKSWGPDGLVEYFKKKL